MSRFLGVDYGSKRVGIALSDESGKMAFPYQVLTNDSNLLSNIVAIVVEKKVDEIVIGHSINREGKPNEVQKAIAELLTDLTLEIGLPVHLESEQYTTQAALRLQGRNDMTDASAAALILDNYIIKNK